MAWMKSVFLELKRSPMAYQAGVISLLVCSVLFFLFYRDAYQANLVIAFDGNAARERLIEKVQELENGYANSEQTNRDALALAADPTKRQVDFDLQTGELRIGIIASSIERVESLKTQVAAALLDTTSEQTTLINIEHQREQTAAALSQWKSDLTVLEMQLDSFKTRSAEQSLRSVASRLQHLETQSKTTEIEINSTATRLKVLTAQLEKEEAIQRRFAEYEDLLQQREFAKSQRDETKARLFQLENKATDSSTEGQETKIQQQELLNENIVQIESDLTFLAGTIAGYENDSEIALHIDRGSYDASYYQNIRQQITVNRAELDALKTRKKMLSQIIKQQQADELSGISQLESLDNLRLEKNRIQSDIDLITEERIRLDQEKMAIESRFVSLRKASETSVVAVNFISRAAAFFAGLVVAFVLPISVASIKVKSDGKIRTKRSLLKAAKQGSIHIAETPHFIAPGDSYFTRNAILMFCLWFMLVTGSYLLLGYFLSPDVYGV